MLFVFDYNERIQLINLSEIVIFNQSLDSFTRLINCKIEIQSDHKMISQYMLMEIDESTKQIPLQAKYIIDKTNLDKSAMDKSTLDKSKE